MSTPVILSAAGVDAIAARSTDQDVIDLCYSLREARREQHECEEELNRLRQAIQVMAATLQEVERERDVARAALRTPCSHEEGNEELKLQRAIVAFQQGLIHSAVRNARPREPMSRLVRWAVVRDAFGVGSTQAKDLCAAAGLNPDDSLSGPLCQACLVEMDEETE